MTELTVWHDGLEWGYLRFLRVRPTLQRLANRLENRRRVK
jgi:hypothetical protein